MNIVNDENKEGKDSNNEFNDGISNNIPEDETPEESFLLNDSIERIKDYILLGYYDRERSIGQDEALKWAWKKCYYFCERHELKIGSLREEWNRLQFEKWMRKEIGPPPLTIGDNTSKETNEISKSTSPIGQPNIPITNTDDKGIKNKRLKLSPNKREALNEYIVYQVQNFIDGGKGSQEQAFKYVSNLKKVKSYKLSPKAVEGRYNRNKKEI